MPFPDGLVDRAAAVANALRKSTERQHRQQETDSRIKLERRRKMILDLKERLLQIRAAAVERFAGSGGGGVDVDVDANDKEELRARLKELRGEFVVGMSALMDGESAMSSSSVVASDMS